MPQPFQNNAPRQLAENFESGDRLRFTVIVEGGLVAKERSETGSWLLTVQVTGMETKAAESTSQSADRRHVERVCPVLWSIQKNGEVELVLDVGSRQRLQALGISAKQKQLLREKLELMPATEAENLLREIANSKEIGHTGPAGQLSEKNQEGAGDEKFN